MTYSYNTHGAPTVGGGLPGLPVRQAGGSGITAGGVIPVDAQLGYADSAPPNSVEYGVMIARDDYPALSDLNPVALEQTLFTDPSGTITASFARLSPDGSLLFTQAAVANAQRNVYAVGDDGVTSIAQWNVGSGTWASYDAKFSRSNAVLYEVSAQSTLSVRWRLSGSWATEAGFIAPSGLPNATGGALELSGQGLLLSVRYSSSSETARSLFFYNCNATTGALTEITTPSNVINTVRYVDTGIIQGKAYSLNDQYAIVCQTKAPYLRVFNVSGASVTEVAQVSAQLPSAPGTLATLFSGKILLVSNGGATLFSISAAGVLTREKTISDPDIGNRLDSIPIVDNGKVGVVLTGAQATPMLLDLRNNTVDILDISRDLKDRMKVISDVGAEYTPDGGLAIIAGNIYSSRRLFLARIPLRNLDGQKLYIKA